MNRSIRFAFPLITLIAVGLASGAQPPNVLFDVLPVAVAKEVSPTEDAYVPPEYRWVRFNLHVSALIDSTHDRPHEFLYRMVTQSTRVRVVDYSPSTELHDTAVGGIAVEKSDEKTHSLGIHLSGAHDGILHADGGSDSQQKTLNRTKYERIAPKEIVSASGTVERGLGVYFKLRSTPTHVLDGQKRFSMTLQVPRQWRGEIVDIQIRTPRTLRSLGPVELESITGAHAHFQILVFDERDDVARRLAWDLGESEQQLRSAAKKHSRLIRQRSLPTIFHHVAAAIDVIEPRISEDWLDRILFGTVEPYFDRQIQQLPVDVKVTVLDYLEAKSRFQTLIQSQEAHSELVVN